MCGRGAVIRGGAGIARLVGARRVVHAPPRPRRVDAAARAAAARGAGAGGAGGAGAVPVGGGMFRDGGGRGPVGRGGALDGGGDARGVIHQASHTTTTETETSLQDEFASEASLQKIDAGDKEASAEQDTVTTSPTSVYTNLNCAPSSIFPVWRMQTKEEQVELLAAEIEANATTIKQDVEELLGESSSSTKQSATGGEVQAVDIIQYMRFGWPNPFGGNGELLINARSETMVEKAMFRKLLGKKRCVIIFDGFYEFHTEFEKGAEVKQPYFFHIPLSRDTTPNSTVFCKDQVSPSISVAKKDAVKPGDSPFPLMYLAGLYDAAIDESSGHMIYSAVILTTSASKEMAPLHTRMPVILTHEDAKRWIDVDHYSYDDLKHLCKPYEGLALYKVPTLVNSWRNKEWTCIEPLEQYQARKKAQGISRFFSPVKKEAAASGAKPSAVSTQASSTAASSSSSFSKASGHPGRLYPTRVNPSDTGSGPGGNKATVADSSNAKASVEDFVAKMENEPLQQPENTAQLLTHTKRRSSSPVPPEDINTQPSTQPQSQSQSQSQPFDDDVEDGPAPKRARTKKATAADRARQQQS